MNKMFVITHKDYQFPNNSLYIPLLVGANNNTFNSNHKCLYDNMKDNISDKNKNYCELTGLYWIWKNSNYGIVGLCHYRRYFFKNRYTKSLSKILSEDDIINILKENDIILPQKKYLIDGSVYKDYANHHNIKDLELCIDIIKNKYPEYLSSINKVMGNNYLYPYNMFIMKKEYLDNYCSWLFDILSELELKIDIDSYDDYNKRLYGFLSERLFNVWIYHNKLKICTKHVNNIEENVWLELMKNKLRLFLSLISKNTFIKKLIYSKRKKKVL